MATWVDERVIGRLRNDMATPALVIDLDAFDRNLNAAAASAKARGIALRPHAKTHKCVEIARRQIAAGAIGLSCAKLAEAETFARAGISGLLITSPVVSRRGIERLIDLARQAPDVMVVADQPANMRDLDAAAASAGITLTVLVDLDVGLHRTGVASVDDGVALARSIEQSTALQFGGIQGYAGHAMHLTGEDRGTSLRDASQRIGALAAALKTAGLGPAIVTGGGTGSFAVDTDFAVLTELQVGSYLFMDREYDDVWTACGEAPPFERALFVDTTVISASHAGYCTVDAGCKAFATDAGTPHIVAGAPAGSRYVFFGDEQGKIEFPCAADRLIPGAVVICQPPHCDPTVNLYDAYHVVSGGAVVDVWPIEARGCAQ